MTVLKLWLCMCALLVLAGLGADHADAVTVETLTITHAKDIYQIAFAVSLAAPPNEVRKALANYALWPKLSDTIVETRVIEALPWGIDRIQVMFRVCLLAGTYCRTIRQVKDFERLREGQALTATFVAAQSDFAAGRERWEIREAGMNRTRLTYAATLEPTFHVPPLIGPWLLTRELRRELIATAGKLEMLAGRGSTQTSGYR